MKTDSAAKITRDLLLKIPICIPGARAWRRNVGAAILGDRMVKFGVPGEADITGIVPGGRRIEIEVKAGRDKQSAAQVSFQSMIEGRGGVYIIARDAEAALAELIRRLA